MKTIDLQTLLQNTVLTSEPLIHPFLCTPPKGSVDDRVAIYANGFYSRLEEVLAGDYSTLALLMGEKAFSQMCRDYIQAYPSQRYSLHFLGQHLNQFLIDTSPYNKKPSLAEMASFEWAEVQSMIASDGVVLSVADLQSIPAAQWPDMIFHLHPSCAILTMQWNSLARIEALRNNSKMPRLTKLKTPQSVIVWRRQREVRYTTLNRSELSMITAIQNQASFVDICHKLCHEMPEDKVADYLVHELHAWLQERLLVTQ